MERRLIQCRSSVAPLPTYDLGLRIFENMGMAANKPYPLYDIALRFSFIKFLENTPALNSLVQCLKKPMQQYAYHTNVDLRGEVRIFIDREMLAFRGLLCISLWTC